MIEQLSLFQNVNPLQELADELIRQVDELCYKFNAKYIDIEVEYGVWEHVKNLGERLSVFINFDLYKCDLHKPSTWYDGIGQNNLNIDVDTLKQIGSKYDVDINVYAEWHSIQLFTIYKKYAKSKKIEKDED